MLLEHLLRPQSIEEIVSVSSTNYAQASYCNIKSYFRSKLMEHNKNKYENQDIKNTGVTLRYLLFKLLC